MKLLKKLLLLIILLVLLIVFDRIRIPKDKEEISQIAQKIVAEKNIQPQNELKVDGCTLWPDNFLGIDISKPCIEHDIYYWIGGAEEERLDADQKLKESENELLPYLGDIMYLGVRIGGNPNLSVGWRWGYGTTSNTANSKLNNFIKEVDNNLSSKKS